MITSWPQTGYVGVCGKVFLASRSNEPVMGWWDGGWHTIGVTLSELMVFPLSRPLSPEEAASLLEEIARD